MTPCSFYGLLVTTVNCPLVTAAMLFYAKVGKREVEWKGGGGDGETGGERGKRRRERRGREGGREGEMRWEGKRWREGERGRGAVCKTAGRLHKR